MLPQFKQHSVLPGFGLTLGFTLTYLSLIVLLPLATLVIVTASMSFADFWKIITLPTVVASFKLSFGASFVAACINAVFGFIVAWSLVRYRFPGRRFVDALIDIPFAMPTAVSGIALTTLYAHSATHSGWLGAWFAPLGIEIVNTPLGIVIALTFIGLPFVVRTLQPALEDLDKEVEEAAESLGASKWQTFYRVIIPSIFPAWATGFTLALARALGEYGSVIFIAGNIPMKTQIVPFVIIQQLEQFNTPAATAIAVVMLAASFMLMFCINMIQWYARKRSS